MARIGGRANRPMAQVKPKSVPPQKTPSGAKCTTTHIKIE